MTRLLGYNLAKELSLEEIESVAGGFPPSSTGDKPCGTHTTYYTDNDQFCGSDPDQDAQDC